MKKEIKPFISKNYSQDKSHSLIKSYLKRPSNVKFISEKDTFTGFTYQN